MPECESVENFTDKVFDVLDDFARECHANTPQDALKYKYATFMVNEYCMFDVDKIGGPTSTYDDFLEALPRDDCRWALFALDVSSLTSKYGPDASSALYVFCTWRPYAAPEDARDLYYGGDDGTAMGYNEAQYTPTGLMRGQVRGFADVFMDDCNNYSDVSYQAVWDLVSRS